MEYEKAITINTARCSIERKLELTHSKKNSFVGTNLSEGNRTSRQIMPQDTQLMNLKTISTGLKPSFDSLMSSKSVSWNSKNMLKLIPQKKPPQTITHTAYVKNKGKSKSLSKRDKSSDNKSEHKEFIRNKDNLNEQIQSENQENIDEKKPQLPCETNYYRELVKQKIEHKKQLSSIGEGPSQIDVSKYATHNVNDTFGYYSVEASHDSKEKDSKQFSFGFKMDNNQQQEQIFAINNKILPNLREQIQMDSLEETQFECNNPDESSNENFSIGSECNVSLMSGINGIHSEIKPAETYSSVYHFIQDRDKIGKFNTVRDVKKNTEQQNQGKKFKINTVNLNQLWNKKGEEIKANLEQEGIHQFKISQVYNGAEDQIFHIINSHGNLVDLKSIKLNFEKRLVQSISIKIKCRKGLIPELTKHMGKIGRRLEYNAINQVQIK